jgi:hypothetical protein
MKVGNRIKKLEARPILLFDPNQDHVSPEANFISITWNNQTPLARSNANCDESPYNNT